MERTYSELCTLQGLEDRFEYLSIGGVVGEATFGFERWVNQRFYRSSEWRQVRVHILARDRGNDLGVEDTPIRGTHIVHHLNPITVNELEAGSDCLIDPENLITTSLWTHNAIHYGDRKLLPQPFVERSPGDTLLWKPLQR